MWGLERGLGGVSMAAGSELTALGRLISDVQAANKWSYADIAENARVAGRRLSKSRVESLRNDRLPSISIKAIEALAAGLRVTPERVAQAALESMGYSLASEAASAQEAISSDPTLSEPVRRVLLAALAAGQQSRDLGQARIQQRAADAKAGDG
jgi:transcriptional regulator with XRE-family HTH domain